jgi:flap endonuclease-1
MGVNLTPVITRHQVDLEYFRGKTLAVDAAIELYQFLSIVRLRDGSQLMDSHGHVTSHLSGIVFRTTRFIADFGIRPIFVFDGKPPDLKAAEIEKRREARKQALAEYEKAKAAGDMAAAWSKAVMSSRLTREMVDDAKRLLSLLGIPFVQAPSEGEAQAASMVQRGQAYTVAGKDYDSLLFGSPRLARFVALQSREFLPSIGRYRVSPPEIIDLEENLKAMSLSRKQLVEAAILVGTDFDEGVEGIGPKKAVEALKKYGSIESLPGAIRDELPPNYDAIREYFLHPEVDENPAVEKKRTDIDAAIKFLCGERDFSEQRVRKALERLAKTAPPARTLESFLE